MNRITLATLKKMDEMGGEFKTASRQLVHRAFDMVCDKKDWKAPVDATIHENDCDFEEAVFAYAVEFFTATPASITRWNGMMLIKADGYRNGPAN